MKSFLGILSTLILSGSLSVQGQTAPAPGTASGNAPRMSSTRMSSSSSAPRTKMKADGSPDMRYKDNKPPRTTTTKMKTDGTPDMRYKANKSPRPTNK